MKKWGSFVFWLMLLLVIAAGCNLPQRSADLPDVEVPTQTAEVTAIPTETPTPLPQREKIVFLPSAENACAAENLSRALEQICTDAYECSEISTPDEIPEDADFVIFAKEPSDLSALIQRHAQAGFIVAADPQTKVDAAWTIQYDEAFLPFLAGLAAAESATDWRSAGMIPSDSAIWGSHAEEAFTNGAHYFCGNCMSKLAPYVSFPLVTALPGSSGPDVWNSRLDEMQRSIIYTVFLSEEAVSDAVLQKIASLNIQMIGVSAPPAGYEANWLATIRFDWALTLQQIIARAMSGEKQGALPVILSVTPGMLRDRFSEGKTTVLQKAYSDLLSGMLSPYTAVNEYSGQ